MLNTQDYIAAVEGEGPLDGTWNDKPHRLVYDLCNEIDRLQREVRIKVQIIDEQHGLMDERDAGIERLEADLAGMMRARNRFCENINQIGRMFWGNDKQCYAPDAVVRKVKQLLAVVEAVKEYIKLKSEIERPTLEEWAEYEAKWQGVVQQAEKLAAETTKDND